MTGTTGTTDTSRLSATPRTPGTSRASWDSWDSWADALPAAGPEYTVDSPKDPAEAAVRLARAGLGGEYVVYERNGTWIYAAGPAATLTLAAEGITARCGNRAVARPLGAAPLEQVADALAHLPHQDWRVYGWAVFELAHLLHPDTGDTGHDPLLHLMLPTTEVALTPGEARIRTADPEYLPLIVKALAGPTGQTGEAALADAEELLRTGPGPYQHAVARTVADIGTGLLQKAVLSRPLPLPPHTAPDLTATYLAGRRANTPARSFLLDLGGWRAAGFSPETVVEVEAGTHRVSTQPLAGTRALGTRPEETARLRSDLLGDPKEIHEHALSVRLAVDELAGICRRETVVVEEFMTVRERGSVQHLASRATGRLADDRGPWDAFAALFPAITATGCPKPEALRTISRYESEPRGLYAGAVFTADADGSLDAALVLRTVFQRDGRTWLRAGAGVMGQSTPEREWEETCEKLRSVAPHLRRSPDTPPAEPR
ncbi:salicylate synthase [Streptomyces swartbergensis]|uniref:Salicylate synthase n=1 Tax=Streptomyces swartbergensis TaxID=487165 RepID=A0A243S8I9_9ACTN|nr:salicylate synthase [Streptomyces swartbergensis]OUD03621.1 salicylate synthase [Streptomyces swartbergensis]